MLKPLTEEQRQQQALILKELSDRMKTPEYKDMTLLIAREAFERFKACQKAGFTLAESLEIAIKKWGQ